jgi:hypothetical protein
MIRNYLNNDKDIDIDVFINSVRGAEIANKLTGYFRLRDQEFRFTAIAFGRIGGNNVAVKVANKTLEKVKSMGIDPELVQLTIQRKLIEGDLIIQTKKPHVPKD